MGSCLRAKTNILFRGRMYEPGDVLPANDLAMTNAWLEAETAAFDEPEAPAEPDPPAEPEASAEPEAPVEPEAPTAAAAPAAVGNPIGRTRTRRTAENKESAQ